MKKLHNIAILLLFGGSISSCGNNTKVPATTNKMDRAEGKEAQEPLKGCYLGVLKRDTFQLAITGVQGENIEGSLLFDFYEKDKSTGTIKGKYSNGVLLADYTFQSEGVTSVRQVIFKKTAKGFMEGYGNIKAEGGKEIIVDTAAVEYSNSVELSRTDICLP